MRIGICSIQQSLTPEATNLVKLAISLARRRGHAQVTPLHVASAMLASPTSLLRTACLHSHSHPLQLKALELCFNVALNRLPSSTSSPLLGPQTMSAYYPSLSNALVAAFKRAQTHQRRGCVENQQQPILALKIEIEQLVISILDDPSVSRVMREAGFSSPHVKVNVEQVVSMDFCAQNLKEVRSSKPYNNVSTKYNASSSSQYEATSKIRQIRQINQFENDDVMSVVHTLMNKKAKSIAIVGETLAVAEAVAHGVMSKIETGEVDGILRYMQFTSLFNLSTLRNLSKQDVEQRLMELRRVIKGYGGRGMALYLGDIKWVAEIWSSYACDEHKRNYLYNPVEHIVIELRKLIFGLGDNSGKVWLMGSASSRTYMKCKLGHPSLESFLELHPIKVPICSLDLSLKIESDCLFDQSKARWYEAETSLKPIKEDSTRLTTGSMSSKLPSWLQRCKDEFECKPMKSPLLKKIRITEKDLMLSMSTPCSPTSVSSSDQPNQTHLSWPAACESKGSPEENQSLVAENNVDPSMEMFMTEISSKPDLLSNPNSSPNSATSSEADMCDMDEDQLPKFKELNDENIKMLCYALEKNAPCQKEAVLEIATTVLRCRSRAMKRIGTGSDRNQKFKEETWMYFVGDDHEGMENVAKDLAQAVFGSLNNFVKMGSPQSSENMSALTQKRKRGENEVEDATNFLNIFGKAVYENPHCVFYVEGLDQFDGSTQKGLEMVIGSGNVELENGEMVHLEDAIVIFSCDHPVAACSSKPNKKADEEEEEKVVLDGGSLDLNVAAVTGDEQVISVSNGIVETVDRVIVFKSNELSLCKVG
uniref:Clp R domain-containing protein n=1 Tax=Kalanchoe fedtschenkoi TaxID=63787 RepID=A0A7N0RCJ6_KALFE